MLFSTFREEALLRASRRSSLLLSAKWFVPGGLKETGSGSSAMLERIRDPVAFPVFLSRSFM
jgi:hypothetical protein